MNKSLNSILQADRVLWIPCAYDAPLDDGDLFVSKTYFGTPTTDKNEAWAAARELCESMDGLGFTVRRADPTAARG
jgi:hypothetical protein